jgi:carbon storage regulator CsrA
MLVLSRSRNERIVFPRLDIIVEILQIGRNKVRIGVKAPPDVSVLREELVPGTCLEEVSEPAEHPPRPLSHELRNRLHTAQLALQLSQKLLNADRQEDAAKTLQQALSEFTAVEEQLSQPSSPRAAVRRALVVEDNANEGELLAAYLRACGYQVETARDGCDAMDQLETRGCPDVILLDMAMPRCDGPSMLRSLRGDVRYDGLTVFAVTGSEPEDFRAANGANRVDRWFQKPVDPASLVREMNDVLALVVNSPN